MVSKRNLLFATLLIGLAACSSHGQNGGVVPQTTERSHVAAVNPATSCAVVPSTVGNFAGLFGGASVSDAWVITELSVNPATQQFEHFTSAGWHTVPPPVTPSFQNIQLRELAAIAPDDVWAAGVGINQPNGNTALFFHWDGVAWSSVPSDPSLSHNFEIETIAGDAPNDVWAIASSAPGNVPTVELERWNGTQWSFVTTIHGQNGFVGTQSRLQVFGPNDVWMMLGTPTPVNFGVAAVIAHWNGTGVTKMRLPPLNGTAPGPGLFEGTASNDLWFAGGAGQSPYIARHTTSWSLYNTSFVAAYFFHDIIDFRPGYALITATNQTRNPALLVYNGYVRWRPTSSPWPSNTTETNGASVVKGTTSFWSAYTTITPLNTPNVALVQCPSSPPAPL
ncbi:MAG: hypothetical protein JO322_09140 [Candidatus Eremiobacteraeota bacterium]|nr:hypothetical protein [Candidatus Eremiobacteraeota bacterium]